MGRQVVQRGKGWDEGMNKAQLEDTTEADS